MSDGQPIRCLRIYPLAIPLRRPFEHAAHSRDVADPIVVEIELADGTLGYGEALARPYVTGETPEGVVQYLRTKVPGLLVGVRPACFAEALEAAAGLPTRDSVGAIVHAARAAVELALLDVYSRHFGRPIADAAGWSGLSGLGPPGSLGKVTYSGVLSYGPLNRMARKVRMMRWYGLRDFKLKVGYDDDRARIAAAVRALGRSLGRTTSLRLDANGAWTPEQAIERLAGWTREQIAAVEQPLDRTRDDRLAEVKAATPLDLMPDESLLTLEDAQRLVAMGVADVFNIRLSKNGGLLPALRLAHWARRQGRGYQLGCMVGETSILSAAGRRFIEMVPDIRHAEGSYGRFLLRGDVVDRPLQLVCGGRIQPLSGLGWGIQVRGDLLRQYAGPRRIDLPL